MPGLKLRPDGMDGILKKSIVVDVEQWSLAEDVKKALGVAVCLLDVFKG